MAHVFLEITDWSPDDMATVKIGDEILLTRPITAAAHLPWPPNPSKRLMARLGDLLEPGGHGFVIESDEERK